VADSRGILGPDRDGLNGSKAWLAANTNQQGRSGDLKRAIDGADVFIGVSGPDVLRPADLTVMASDSIVFALANPDPEVDPAGAREHAAVVATGRSDHPNQINNVLAFPGVFRGALDARARFITEEMKVAAARALADVIGPDELRAAYIIPSPFDERVAPAVAAAVRDEAKRTGV
jgi:malate dehydrogenase (oxaloacetate-decarboxylating)